jgi:hypothetical protein
MYVYFLLLSQPISFLFALCPRTQNPTPACSSRPHTGAHTNVNIAPPTHERPRGVTNEFTSFVKSNGSSTAVSGAAASPSQTQHREVSIYLICKSFVAKSNTFSPNFLSRWHPRLRRSDVLLAKLHQIYNNQIVAERRAEGSGGGSDKQQNICRIRNK